MARHDDRDRLLRYKAPHMPPPSQAHPLATKMSCTARAGFARPPTATHLIGLRDDMKRALDFKRPRPSHSARITTHTRPYLTRAFLTLVGQLLHGWPPLPTLRPPTGVAAMTHGEPKWSLTPVRRHGVMIAAVRRAGAGGKQSFGTGVVLRNWALDLGPATFVLR